MDSFYWFSRNYVHLHLNEFSQVRSIYRFLEELSLLSLALFMAGKGFNFKCNVVMDAVSHYINFAMQMRVACDERRFLSLAHRSLSATIYGAAVLSLISPDLFVAPTDRIVESRAYRSYFPARPLLIFLIWITHGRKAGLIFVACEGACLPRRQRYLRSRLLCWIIMNTYSNRGQPSDYSKGIYN